MFTQIIDDFQHLKDEKKAEQSAKFFKTGKGEYGEGDTFLGVYTGDIRNLVKKYKDAPLEDIEKCICYHIHEVKMFGTLSLVNRYKSVKSEDKKAEIYNFYLKNIDCFNNWDFIDQSAHYIIGDYIFDKQRDILYELAKSPKMFRRRAAVVACLLLIKQNDFDDILKLCSILIDDHEDLMHKACGWMLREVGKKDLNTLRLFLTNNIKYIPRTTLRYAIEKMCEEERQTWLKK